MGNMGGGGVAICWTLSVSSKQPPLLGIIICPPNTKAERECQATELTGNRTRNQK